MKDPSDRTKVVLRHLPPALSQSALAEQIDGRFAGRYNRICFRPGKNSQKHQLYSRAYIDFKQSEDVVEFAEFFDGHVFVNEKGAQFKAIVEYAPSQRVPKPSRKDGREGTIFKDLEYLEFLELIAKPVENLPSAEIQLERREAERAGAVKESPIVTPLMDFVRQKRAAKGGSQRSSSNGKLSRRARGASPGNSSSAFIKRGSEKKKYVLRDGAMNTSGKDRSTYILVPRQVDQQLADKSVSAATATGTEIFEDESVPHNDGVTGASDAGKKKILLLKGKEREISLASGGVSQPQNVISPMRNSPSSITSKQNPRREASGRMIRTILLNKEPRQSQLSTAGHPEQQIQTLGLEKDRRPPRPTNIRSVSKDHISSNSQASCGSNCDMKKASDDKVTRNYLQGFGSTSEKQEKRTRNKDRPDRGIWTPLRRSDGSHASDESLSDSLDAMTITKNAAPGVSKVGDDVVEDYDPCHKSGFSSGKPRNLDTAVHSSRLGRGGNSSPSNDLPVSHGEVKGDIPYGSKSEVKTLGSGHSNFSSVENGFHRHVGRRGPPHGGKDVDGSLHLTEGKPSKRGGSTGYGSHEKQVWVQKSGSGS